MKPKTPSKLREFLWPSSNAPFIRRILPYAVLAVLGLVLMAGASAGWTYTNSSPFCGETCHTMPPQYTTYLRSPHARVDCVECHIGRGSIATILPRKVQHSDTVYKMILHEYEYPIVAEKMRPANEACETCHYPRKFSTDSLREVRTHANDETSTPESTFLLLKTGGGSKREGLGRGIHWHIENQVYFYATDQMEQNIPYVKVVNDDGSVDEYIDIASGFNPATDAADLKLKKVDCITCHNRITHSIPSPEATVDTALYTGVISDSLPFVRKVAIDALMAEYTDQDAANSAFDQLNAYYKEKYPDVYTSKKDAVNQLVTFLKSTYAQTHFPDQKLAWNTHPNNTGHTDSPGCFRCHDGKHLNANQQVVRMECNLCHSIPSVNDPSQFVANVSIVRGAEPASHTNSAWIALHGKVVDNTCGRCHPPANPGQDWTQLRGQKPPADGSSCGNSACHQSEWKFLGFNAKEMQPILSEEMKQILQLMQDAQQPTP